MPEVEHKLKKLIKALGSKKGRHTELVTVYIPAGYSIHEVVSQLKQEQGTAENIKSKPVRKNVVTALEKIMRHLQLYKGTPKNGLALFCGNISEKEGVADIELWAIEPPDPVKTRLYWCDQKFVMEPLEKMVEEKQIYGVVCLDKSEADVALLRGKKLEPLVHFDSIVPGKTRAGGQCLAPDTLVQMGDGNIVEIDNVSNPHIIKSVDFNTIQLKNRPVIEQWVTKKASKYIITTKCPTTQIESSKEHTFFKWGNKIEEIAAEDLKKGDFLLLPEKIDVEGEIQSLDVSSLYNSYKINEKGREYIKQRRIALKLLQKELAKSSDVTQTAISIIELGKRDIKIGFLKRLCQCLDIDTGSFIRQFCIPVKDFRLPEILDENLANLLGYFAGDGSFENERISLFDADRQTIEYYNNLAKTIFNCNATITHREDKGHYVSRIYGKPIIKLIKNEFPELKFAVNTEIPVKVLRSPNSVLAAFLRGFFDAEGYVTKERGIGLGINNKKLARQAQMALLRFGILASLAEYDNKRNPHSKKHRFTIGITEKKSLEIFLDSVGFNASYKNKKLAEVIKNKSPTSYTRQIFLTGENIRKIVESNGCKLSDFKKVTNFFRNERLMGKEVFKSSILNEIKNNKTLYEKLNAVLDYNLIPVKISSIRIVEERSRFVDIEVKNSNFIANGLVVHNSSARFSRIREGLLNDFLKEVGDAVNKTFLDKKEVVGILLGGPGPIKDILLKENYIDNNVKKKILGTVDVGSTGEHGLHETIQRGEHLIKEAAIIQEKKILQQFFEGLQKGSAVAYGLESVIKALEMGAVDMVIVTEDAPYEELELECQCGTEKRFVRVGKDVTCGKCGKLKKILGRKEIVEALEEAVKNYSTKLEVVSSETREGEQFSELGGIGAILRYEI
ncbi:MAG: helix-turn-helix domain-containing protein [Candidatus Aenigmarchaeota archaeon]|nr:helix-turn-helix domain-containing protein [Candidatus Aenigmarchaeota archaeon]